MFLNQMIFNINNLLLKVQNDGIIHNNIIAPSEGDYNKVGENPLGSLIARLWHTLTILAGILMLAYLIWGAIDWISSKGDPQKITDARGKMSAALIGLAILTLTFAIVNLVGWLLGFDILNLNWAKAL